MTKAKAVNSISTKLVKEFRGQILEWYDTNKRTLPWRALPDQIPDPYHVWLSEIMLQQTTVGAVMSYFQKFITLWPSIHDLAKAPQEDIMNEWAGLGYYNRARNLHACAKIVVNDFGGVFPDKQVDLKKLPGIGDYTSAAIMTIAFNKPASVMDGNIERIMARIFAVQDPLPKSKPILKKYTDHMFHDFTDRPGDLAQAMMDLGAGVCIAKTPRCALCPVSHLCAAKEQEIAATLPKKEKKKPKPQKFGFIYWVENEKGQILLHRRPDKGLLGGMLALPTSEWIDQKQKSVLKDISLKNTQSFGGKAVSIHHSFTHFDLELHLKTASAFNQGFESDDTYNWHDKASVKPSQFPTVFKKAVNLFLKS